MNDIQWVKLCHLPGAIMTCISSDILYYYLLYESVCEYPH